MELTCLAPPLSLSLNPLQPSHDHKGHLDAILLGRKGLKVRTLSLPFIGMQSERVAGD